MPDWYAAWQLYQPFFQAAGDTITIDKSTFRYLQYYFTPYLVFATPTTAETTHVALRRSIVEVLHEQIL
jgi:hypothetical protein